MNKKTRILVIATAILLLIAVMLTPAEKPPDLSEPVKVLRVIDGDTIEIENDITVRMIGIDTPESVHPDENKNTEYGKIASEYTGELLTGKAVQLEYDTELTDTYGRTLAYVYLDGEMVNELLLQKGLAKTMTIPPNTKYVDRFSAAEQEASRNAYGFWSSYFKDK